MKNVFLEVINSVNLVNKKMNDNMKSLFSKYIKLLAVLLLSVAGVGQAWGDTKTYNFDDGVALSTDWNVSTVVPAGGTAVNEITNSLSGASFSAQDGKYLGLAYKNKSGIEITLVSKVSYENISNVSLKVVSGDNSKPTFAAYIVNGSGTVLETLFAPVGSKNGFATGGTNKWGSKSVSVSSKTGYLKIVTVASSSGKYAAIDDIVITYTPGGGGGCTSPSVTLSETAASITTAQTYDASTAVSANTGTLSYSVTGTAGGSISAAGVYTPATAGTATITVTANGTGDPICDDPDSKTITVTVSAAACTSHAVTAASNNNTWGTAAAGTSPVCEGSTTTVTATPASGYRFVSWAVSGTGSTLSSNSTNPTTLTMGTADATVTATFEAIPTHTVTTSTETGDNSQGTVTVTPSTVAEGGTATVTATPASGYEFDHWTVSGTGATLSSTTTATATLTMGTANATVTAYFRSSGGGGGGCGTISIDFSDAKWSGITSVSGDGSNVEHNGITFHSSSSKPFAIDQSAGTMTWCNNNANSSDYFIAIPLSIGAGDVTVSIDNGSNKTQFKGSLLSGSSISGPGGSTSSSSTADPAVLTFSGKAAGNYVLYLGRTSSSQVHVIFIKSSSVIEILFIYKNSPNPLKYNFLNHLI